jgi:2-polyprenyl-3-methyl-5-hydroxy-6-metoxy-1,4-benzoquinol methylase
VWDALADWWAAAIGGGNATQDLLVEPTQQRLLDLRSGQHLLDIACGAGRVTRRMAALGAEIVAFDHSENFIAWARENTPPDLGSRRGRARGQHTLLTRLVRRPQ